MHTMESLVGRTVAGYALTTQLSSDLFKHVYLGEKVSDTGEKQAVTLKYFQGLPLATMDRQQKFLHEAEQLKSLIHPYILPIVDYGIDGETAIPYIISGFAPFRSLHNRILRQWPQAFPLDEALTLITRTGEALAYAHEQKVVHGNLSAQSVLFNANQEALLADFNLASLRADLPLETTEAYLAPGMDGAQGDVYALAGLLAAMLSSGQNSTKTPLRGRTLNSPGNWLPPNRQALPSTLPGYLHQALSRALDPDPGQRFASAQEFLSAIQVFPAPSQSQSTKSQPLERTETEERKSTQPESKLPVTSPLRLANEAQEAVAFSPQPPKSHVPASRRAPRTTGTLAPNWTSQTPSVSTSPVKQGEPGQQLDTDKLTPVSEAKPFSVASELVEQETHGMSKGQSAVDESKRIDSMLEQLQSNYASLKQLKPEEREAESGEAKPKVDTENVTVLSLVALSTKPPAPRHRGRFLLALSLLAVICLLVGSVLFASQQKASSNSVSMAGSTATRIAEQAQPGRSGTQQARQTTITGTTPSAHVTPTATSGTKQPTRSKGTATTNQPAQPTTTLPTQAPTTAPPAPAMLYSFEGSSEGWQSSYGTLQSSSQYSYDGAYSLKATISRQSYLFIRGQITEGQTVTAYVYIPSGTPSMTADISIGNLNDVWDDGPTITLVAGQWTRVSYTIGKTNTPSPQIGIDLNAPGSVNAYVDAFSWG